MSREGDIKVLMECFKINEEQATTMLDKNVININFIKNGMTPALDDRFTQIKDGFEKDIKSIVEEFNLDLDKD